MFASQHPLVKRIKFDGIDAEKQEFGTEKKEKTLYD
jgi:hypothetical protein